MVLSGKLSEKLKSEAKALWTEAAEKEFLVSMAKGTLDTELFKNYMVQDYLYLKDYIGILKQIREMAEDEKLAVFLDGIIGDTEYETYKVHVPNLRSLGISEEDAAQHQKGQVIVDYMDFMRSRLEEYGILAGLTALLQCSWNYAYIADAVSERYPDELVRSRYKNWFEAYTNKAYIESNRRWIDALDERTADISNEDVVVLCEIFKTCAEYENKFWDYLNGC